MQFLVQVYDWYHAGDDSLRVESPAAFPAADVTTPDFSDEHSATFTVSVTGATPPQSGSIEMLITAVSEKTGYGGFIPGASVSAYFFASAAVDDEAPPQPTEAPWPRFHRDYGCKGLTDVVGTLNSTPKWNFNTGGALSEGIAIDDEGTAYFGSCSGSFYAVKADGSQKWSYGPTIDHIKSSPASMPLGMFSLGPT